MKFDIQNLIIFMIYSYLGATLEHISYYIDKDSKPKMLANPIITGFPLYGIGAYLMIITNNFLENENIIVKFIVNGIIISIFEYIIGIYVGAGSTSYKNDLVDSWDYTNEKCNVHGIISLRHFISWSILGIILDKLHPVLINKIGK